MDLNAREALDVFHHVTGHGTETILWWQMSVRAVIIFFYAILLYRMVPGRALGKSAAPDIVVAVIVGSSLSRALTGTVPLLPTMAAMGVMMVLYVVLIFLSRQSRIVSRVFKGRSLVLIRDGIIDREALARAQLGERDVRENLRLQGIDDIREVEEARLERNGSISVIKAG